jgi:hypothetical protein
VMGFAALYPSYAQRALRRLTRRAKHLHDAIIGEWL